MIVAFTGAGISKESGIDTFMDRPDIRDCLHREFAIKNPKKYCDVVATMKKDIDNAEPNAAHFALAKGNIDIITMNVDTLHEKAGSKHVLHLHGSLPTDDEMAYAHELYNKPVLYGDLAPNYSKAIQKVSQLGEGDIFLVIGASRYTQIAIQLRDIAYLNGAEIMEIQEDASKTVPDFIERFI
jgi:NAD-dependent deacetylase